MQNKKPWLGTFEEKLYEKITEPIRVTHLRMKTRKCMRCAQTFKSKNNWTCQKCKQTLGELYYES